MTDKPNFSFIVNDNEKAIKEAFDRGDYTQAILLIHALIESLLRLFLGETQNKRVSFSGLIKKYDQFLHQENYPNRTFVDELVQFNLRRNRIVHELWQKGYSLTNRQAKEASTAALMMYGLFIEWLETFGPEITRKGFRYD